VDSQVQKKFEKHNNCSDAQRLHATLRARTLQNKHANDNHPSRFSIQITFNLPLLKMKKCTSQSARALIALLLCSVACLAVTGTLLAWLRPEPATNVSQRNLTFAERVAYQHAIEDVYWRHRIWPKERPNPKPSLDAVMSQAQLETKLQITCGNYRRSRITGKGQLPLSSYKPKWIAWQSTPGNPRCFGNSLQLLATTRLLSPSA
jgi:hypothetical protein